TRDVEKSEAAMQEAAQPKDKALTGERFRELALEQLKKMKYDFTFAADHTVKLDVIMFGMAMSGTGTWQQNGSTVTVTPKTEDGKPLEGARAKPQDLTVEGDRLALRS